MIWKKNEISFKNEIKSTIKKTFAIISLHGTDSKKNQAVCLTIFLLSGLHLPCNLKIDEAIRY